MTFGLRAAQEGHGKRIELKEQDPHLAARMLQHLYSFDYPGHKISIGDDEESSHVSELHTHVQMYALGDKYDIEDLKEEAVWKFKKAVEAKKGHGDELTTLVEVIPTVYATTPNSDRGLRDAVVAFGVDRLEQIKDLPEFGSAVTRVPVYLIEVLPGFLKRVENKRRRYKEDCSHCRSAENWEFDGVYCCKCRSHLSLQYNARVPAS